MTGRYVIFLNIAFERGCGAATLLPFLAYRLELQVC